jgi:peptide/nickel transport system permease protein
LTRFPWIATGCLAIIALGSIGAPLFGLPDPAQIDIANRLRPPNAEHWLGQDEFGRDVLSRLLWGGRISLTVAITATLIACVLGTALGVLGGFLRGGTELLTVRTLEIILCLPPMLLALLVVTLVGPGVGTLIFVLSVLYAPRFGRVAYGSVVAIRSREYVQAMQVLGAAPPRIMLGTVLPNIAAPVLTQASLAASSAIVLEAGLSFLGVGIVPPLSSWGVMIRGARDTMGQAPWLLLFPCVALTATILCLNAICDAIAVAMNPQPRALGGKRPPLAPATETGAAVAPLDVRGLDIAIDGADGRHSVVRDVSFTVAPGETLAIVGESGSGKSLTALALMGLLPGAATVTGGRALVDGQDMLRLPEEALRGMRGRAAAMVFQDPLSSLDPVHRVGTQIAEAIRAHRPQVSWRDAWAEAEALLRRVGIPDPARCLRAYPHELSGGMRQRVGIAAAIANGPGLVIADEPTSALDVTIQAQILDLLATLKRERGMSLVFITHSLPVVSEIADRLAVMYAGEIVEMGAVDAVLDRPHHPYTAALLASVPDEDGTAPRPIGGQVPPLHAMPSGCRFAPRCSLAVAACAERPPLVQTGADRFSRCFRWSEA